MKKSELLAPAGSFEIGKAALYSGADAIYLALESFGARAYAKNFSIEELTDILKIAHTLNKKVYVTVNTLIKNSELTLVYDFIDKLYMLGVDAIICADIAVFMYVINNCKPMECHISTQVGVKDLLDTKFFESINANRVVLARELNINQIKEIKENSNIELEVFIHGALCVSYSGGCLFSSLLSLRSGNRGRCSQNCRREYVIHENGVPITKPGYYLSMKDLCVSTNVKELLKINIDSLKIEGRMKNIIYVDSITRYYRNLLDNKPANIDELNKIFHRQYTKGFIFGEDPKNISTIKDSSSQGKYIGKVTRIKNNKIYINSLDVINVGDRLRFVHNDISIYITVSLMYDENGIKIEEAKGLISLECSEKIESNSLVYKMKENDISVEINSNILPLSIFLYGKKENKLGLTCCVNDEYFTIESDSVLQKAIKNPLSCETIINQISKLNDTPFYIDDISFDIEDDMFISLSEINNLRRKMVEYIYNKYHKKRNVIARCPLYLKKRNINYSNAFVAVVQTREQYDACKELGISNIFFKNISPYVNSKYNSIDEEEVLVGNYGGLIHYFNKIITTDYSFNVMNKDSILHLLNQGAQHVTLSPEISFNELKDLSIDFYNSYGVKPPVDYIVYGKNKLMSLKYCPLKGLGRCGKCHTNEYHLVDKLGKFIIKTKDDCIVEIYNDSPLNLIEEITKIKGGILNE